MFSRPGVTHRSTAVNHPKGKGMIERFQGERVLAE
jgi:hypothetical protein